MSQSLAKVAIHIIFSTKGRKPWLQDEAVRKELWAYMATVLKGLDSPAVTINGIEDHVHILCTLSRNHAIKKIVEDVKKSTSKWIKGKGAPYVDFYWQGGYGVFSVSESKIEEVKNYILHQEKHHQKLSFQQEYRAFCERHGVEIDEGYVWD